MRKFCQEISLAFLSPEISKEWDFDKNYPLKPESVFSHSRKKVWWICKICHQNYFSSIDSRSNGSGCPFCCGKKVCAGNCLSNVNPSIAQEWHPKKNGKLTANDVTMCSNKKVWWICENGHEYKEVTRVRTTCNSNCSVCNSLGFNNHRVSKNWHPTKNGELTPYEVSFCSHKKVWWMCNKGHEFKMYVSDKLNVECPFCSGRRVCDDNCLSNVNPSLAKEWHPTKNGKLTTNDITSGSGKKVWRMCKSGHEWIAVVAHRNNGNGCPFCHKVKLDDGTVWDSLSEAYCYLKLKSKYVDLENHISIGLGKCICDFYIPSENLYIEVTGYNQNWKHWKTYYRNILKKERYITTTLNAKFEFVKVKLTINETLYVRNHVV